MNKRFCMSTRVSLYASFFAVQAICHSCISRFAYR